jgi:cell division protein FtsZ
MVINIRLPENDNFTPTITVFGVGGAGCNAVNNMIRMNLVGVNFVIANTDAQAIQESICHNKIQLGMEITKGLGAGSYPEVGRASAEESQDIINDYLEGNNMVFITAGMGGGTGSGAAPVIAKLAKEKGILTVGVVTKPFHFEGAHRMRIAELGLQEIQKYVDTLIVIPNQNLFRIADKKTTFLEAFKLADHVLYSGVRGITDLMLVPGLINLDFADVRSIMGEMGKAMMGTGESNDENRAIKAAESAISNPLLDNVSMKGARGVLINITGGDDMTLYEVDESVNRIREEIDPDANIIFGSAFDTALNGKIRVSVVATGIEDENSRKASFFQQNAKPKISEIQHLAKQKNTAETINTQHFFAEKPEVPLDEFAENRNEFLDQNSNQVFSKLVKNEEIKSMEKELEKSLEPQKTYSFHREENYIDDIRKKKPSFFGGIFKKSNTDNNELNAEEEEILGLTNPINQDKEIVINTNNNANLGGSGDIEIPAFLRRRK